jgi:hypothetical protein
MRKSVFIATLVLAICPVLALGQTIHLTSADVATTPVVLDQPNTTYILDADITAPGSAIAISYAASGSRLDLNGHTVTFGTAGGDFRFGILLAAHNYRADFWPDVPASAFGGSGAQNVEIYGGRLQQGAGEGVNCSAISGSGIVTIRDMELQVSGVDCRPIYLPWSKGATVRDNTVEDNAIWVTNRHQGRASIDIEGGDVNGYFLVEGNIVRNSPQWGIRVQRRTNDYTPSQPVIIRNNDVSQNTVVTNGYGIGIHSGMTQCYGNYVHPVNGRGLHLNTYDGMDVHDNTVVVREIGNSEYEYMYSHGINLEECANADVYNNTVTAIARHDSDMFYTHPLTGATNATYSAAQALVIHVAPGSNCRVFDNHFMAFHEGGNQVSNDHFADYASAMYIRHIAGDSGLQIFGNTFESNSQLIGVSWDNSGDVELDMTDNTWIRDTTPADGHQFVESFHTNRAAGAVYNIINPVFQGDINFRRLARTSGTGAFTINEIHQGNVRVISGNNVGVPGAEVTVQDGNSQQVWQGYTNAQGEAAIPALSNFSLVFNGSSESVTESGSYSVSATYQEDGEQPENSSGSLDLNNGPDLVIQLGTVTIEGPGIPVMKNLPSDIIP